MTRSDDELLDALRDALVPPDLSPGPMETARFRQALEAGRADPRPRRAIAWRALRFPPGLVAAGAVFVAALGAIGGGVAADTLPGPLRTAAYDMGLPVSSPALVTAQGAETALRHALQAGDRMEVVVEAAALRQRLSALDPADRLKVDPEGITLLAKADAFLAANPPPGQAPIESSPTGPPEASTTEPPEASTSVPPEASTTEPPEASTTVPAEGAESPPPPSTTTGGDGRKSSSGGDGTSSGSDR
ncbi:MAG TPA: hypothetical protein VNC61_14805 [Acidimicrobiales bacterium]|nr:hypothetical protein [Acidimicrobiales bacterium]